MTVGGPYYVYILMCSDETLYTGYAADPEERLVKHNLGLASKYTRSRRPVDLVYCEKCTDKSAALRREKAIKGMSRREKLVLISGDRMDNLGGE